MSNRNLASRHWPFFSAAPSSDVNPRVRETVRFWNPLACWKVVDGPCHPGRNQCGSTILWSSRAYFLCTSYSSIAASGKVEASAFWILLVWSCLTLLICGDIVWWRQLSCASRLRRLVYLCLWGLRTVVSSCLMIFCMSFHGCGKHVGLHTKQKWIKKRKEMGCITYKYGCVCVLVGGVGGR